MILPEDSKERTSSLIVYLPLVIAIIAAAFYYWSVRKPTEEPVEPAAATESIPVTTPESEETHDLEASPRPEPAAEASQTPLSSRINDEDTTESTGQQVMFVFYDTENGIQFARSEAVLPVDAIAGAKHLLDLLKSEAHIPPEIAVRKLYRLHESLLLIDLQISSFSWCKGGILEEAAVIATVVSTITTNIPQIQAIRFTVNGQEMDTLCGHISIRNNYTHEQALAMLEKLPHF